MTLVFAPHNPEPSMSLQQSSDLTVPTIGEIHSWFRQLTRLDLQELEKRFVSAVERNQRGGDARADGFPSGRPGSGGMDSGTSTETSALASYVVDGEIEDAPGEWRDEFDQIDVVQQNLVLAAERLWNAVADLNAVDRRMRLDEHLSTFKRSYDPSGHCQACDRFVVGTSADRLRAGYCDTDYRAWLRAGRPERTTFERSRRQQAS